MVFGAGLSGGAFLAARAGCLALAVTLMTGYPLLAQQAPDDQQAEVVDLMDMSLEQLLSIDVSVASYADKPLREQPGVVTLVTRADIRRTGARDLIDIINLVPGFRTVSEVHETVSLGSRGIYAAEGKSQLKRMGPEISRRLNRQLDLLGQELNMGVHAQLTVAENRIKAHTLEALFAAYPELRDSAEQRMLTASFQTIAESAVVDAVSGFDRKFSDDIDALAETIFEFNEEESEETTVDLQKKFIHLWLQMIDAEIMKL